METIRFIGDVHGRIAEYQKLIENRHTIQVGDLGTGFVDISHLNNTNNLFIRGNHDDPNICRQHPCWIPDGFSTGNIMFVGGGYSIDHAFRVPYRDWWPDEELSDQEFDEVFDKFYKLKPEIMITHECPSEIASILFGPCPYNLPGMVLPDRTSIWFDLMWDIHKPKLWIFGHFHERRDQVINNTRFICLEELGVLDLNLEE